MNKKNRSIFFQELPVQIQIFNTTPNMYFLIIKKNNINKHVCIY